MSMMNVLPQSRRRVQEYLKRLSVPIIPGGQKFLRRDDSERKKRSGGLLLGKQKNIENLSRLAL
jgi:hypothetical protein